MSTEITSKLNLLLTSQPPGTVMLSSWLKTKGYSLELQRRYKKSQWLESVGSGAMIRARDNVYYEGAIYALQTQSGMTVHPGGKTAIAMLGLSHYLEFGSQHVIVFADESENLPLWFKNHHWGTKIKYHKTSFLPAGVGLVEKQLNNFSIKISNAPRAIMECLYLVPDEQDLMECFHFMESMNNVRPAIVQELLENCKSVKVKRLFVYLAEKANHAWFSRLQLDKIDLGKGKRSVIRQGAYNSKYQITVSKELEQND